MSGAENASSRRFSGGSSAPSASPPETPSHREDVVQVARAECVRLQASNAELRERLAQVGGALSRA